MPIAASHCAGSPGAGGSIRGREYAEAVEAFLDGAQAKLTQASLETLAVIAYRQPISRGPRSTVIRTCGPRVTHDEVVGTLVTRGPVEEAGADESGAVLYGTIDDFLERMGLGDLAELPALAPYLPDVASLQTPSPKEAAHDPAPARRPQGGDRRQRPGPTHAGRPGRVNRRGPW